MIAEGSKIKAASIGTNPKVDGAFVSGVTVSLTIDGEVIVGDDSSSSKSIGNVWNRQNGTLTVSESGSLTVLGGQLSNRGDIVVYGALTREVWSGTVLLRWLEPLCSRAISLLTVELLQRRRLMVLRVLLLLEKTLLQLDCLMLNSRIPL